MQLKQKERSSKSGIVPFVLFILLKKVDERMIKFYTLIKNKAHRSQGKEPNHQKPKPHIHSSLIFVLAKKSKRLDHIVRLKKDCC